MNTPQLGELILFHRKRAGLSREACALLAGVGKTAVYDLEHGKETIRLDILLKILKCTQHQFTIQQSINGRIQA